MTTKIKQIQRAYEGEYSIRKDEESGKNYIDFYPSVFNQRSKLIREWGEVFFEIISPSAFSNVLKDPALNTIATVDHDRSKMIGRTKSGTLQLSVDSKGLKASLEIPDTNLGRDLQVMIERGDYFECSFIYTIAEGGVHYDRSEEIPVRTITDIDRLYDVSIVVDGAFANTIIKKRALELEDDEAPETEKKTNSPARYIRERN
jgi:uncharacterized protein